MTDTDEFTFYSCEYPDYKTREDIKKKAWKGIRNGNPRLQVHCLLRGLIWAHYWRCRESLDNDTRFYTKVLKSMYEDDVEGLELEIDKYITHWLYSHKDRVSPEALLILEEEWHYKPVKNKYLPDGHTDYIELYKIRN